MCECTRASRSNVTPGRVFYLFRASSKLCDPFRDVMTVTSHARRVAATLRAVTASVLAEVQWFPCAVQCRPLSAVLLPLCIGSAHGTFLFARRSNEPSCFVRQGSQCRLSHFRQTASILAGFVEVHVPSPLAVVVIRRRSCRFVLRNAACVTCQMSL